MRDELDRLIEQELDHLYRYVYRRVRDSYRAEDITQDIILQAYRAYPRLRNQERLQAWLWGIASNMVARSYRASPETSVDEITIIDLAGISYETPATEYLRRQDILRVRRALSYLARTYREVCVLYYLENKDYNTIARELNIPLSSVKWRLNQSKEQLKEELEKMDYMEHGYRKATPLYFNMGGWVGQYDKERGAYDNADKVLMGSLLAQNICQVAYREPKTVTEIASEMGVAADYIEAELERILPTQAMRKVGNRYQTMFPIWDEATCDDVFGGNVAMAREICHEAIDLIYACADDVAKIGFYGCDWGMDRLILVLLGYLCRHIEHNEFYTDALPFVGNDKAWYILASSKRDSVPHFAVGINSAGSKIGLREFSFVGEKLRDTRSMHSKEQQQMVAIYLGETPDQDEHLASLIENGKVTRDGDAFRLCIPVIDEKKGEGMRLREALAPAIAKLNDMQNSIYRRSMETVARSIPAHIADQRKFFGEYCCHCVPELALYEELVDRGVTLNALMGAWCTLYDDADKF